MRASELIRRLSMLRPFASPDPSLEQVATPPEAAATLLLRALARGDLEGRSVADLGCGAGPLAIGAALLGASPVYGIDADPRAVEVARANAADLKVELRLASGRVEQFESRVDTVVMNPPFGAQLRYADRPFWETALRVATTAVYAFALADSRTFIARSVVERGATILSTEPVPWSLPATFRHHRKARVGLPVDLWVLGTRTEHE
jgi:putative methylase